MYSQADVKKRIEDAAERLGLDAGKLMAEFGVTTALMDMLENEVEKEVERNG